MNLISRVPSVAYENYYFVIFDSHFSHRLASSLLSPFTTLFSSRIPPVSAMLSLTLVSLLLSPFLLLHRAAAVPCIAMDTSFNLLVFGVDGKDWNAGTQDSWTDGAQSFIPATTGN